MQFPSINRAKPEQNQSSFASFLVPIPALFQSNFSTISIPEKCNSRALSEQSQVSPPLFPYRLQCNLFKLFKLPFRHFERTSRTVPEQCQCNFRALSEQSQISPALFLQQLHCNLLKLFKLLLQHFKSPSRTVPVQCQCNSRALSEQSQISPVHFPRRLQCNFVTNFKSPFGHFERASRTVPGQCQCSSRAVWIDFHFLASGITKSFQFHVYSMKIKRWARPPFPQVKGQRETESRHFVFLSTHLGHVACTAHFIHFHFLFFFLFFFFLLH